MGRWSQSRRRGCGGGGRFALPPPINTNDWDAIQSGTGVDGQGDATCRAGFLEYQWRVAGDTDWLAGSIGPCDESVPVVPEPQIVGTVFEVQARWSDGSQALSEWSDTYTVTIT